jgi:hypothetical protein
MGIINSLLNPFLTSTIGIISGLFISLKPELTIQLQSKFYEKINWRLQPVSMPKEIRNTQRMGIFLSVVGLVAITYSLINFV